MKAEVQPPPKQHFNLNEKAAYSEGSVAHALSETLSTKTYDKVSDKGKNPAGFGVGRLAPPNEVFY